MNVAEYIVSELANKGITDVFTLCGGFSMYLNDAIGHSKLNPVYCLHESGAAFAACGHASYTGKLSVCVVTSGPGVTNALTGCASAWADSLPVLFISGEARLPFLEDQIKYHLREAGPQDVPTKKLVENITKMSIILKVPETVPNYLNEAIKVALEPRRGPTWLILPLDVSKMEMPNAIN